MRQHHDEIGEKYTLEPDYETYEVMDKVGNLQIVGARIDGKLVGYCLFFICKNLSNRNMLVGTQNIWFVLKEYRQTMERIGHELMVTSIRLMKIKGVQRIYPHHWGDSPALKRYFESKLGAQKLENGYVIVIGD